MLCWSEKVSPHICYSWMPMTQQCKTQVFNSPAPDDAPESTTRLRTLRQKILSRPRLSFEHAAFCNIIFSYGKVVVKQGYSDPSHFTQYDGTAADWLAFQMVEQHISMVWNFNARRAGELLGLRSEVWSVICEVLGVKVCRVSRELWGEWCEIRDVCKLPDFRCDAWVRCKFEVASSAPKAPRGNEQFHHLTTSLAREQLFIQIMTSPAL